MKRYRPRQAFVTWAILVFSGRFKDGIKWGKRVQNPCPLPLQTISRGCYSPGTCHQQVAWQLGLSSLLNMCLFLSFAGMLSKSVWEQWISVYSPHLTWCDCSRDPPQCRFFITREKQLNRTPAKTDLRCLVLIFQKQAGHCVLEPEEMLLIGCLLFFNNIWHVSK